jgi:hypothetical protein
MFSALTGRQTELRAVACRLNPFSGAARRQPRPDTEDGTNAELARRGDDRLQLTDAVQGDDDLPAELLGQERRLDEGPVLVSVAEGQGFGILLQGQSDQQLGFGASLDPESVGTAVVEELLDDMALLVDLDGVDPAVLPLVVVLGDGLLEGAEQLVDEGLEDVGEADQDRELETAVLEIVDEGLEIDPGQGGTRRPDLDIPAVVDGEEVASPAVNVVELDGVLDRPRPDVCGQLDSATSRARPRDCA